MTKEQARERVLQLAVLQGLSPKLRAKMADIFLGVASPQRVSANTVLFRKGQASNDEGFVLLDGDVSVLKEGVPEFIAPAPDIIGEIAHISPAKQRSASVSAANELKILRFKWSAFLNAAQQHLSAEEVQQFTSALQEYAWKHFTE
jgi:CRP-like cAMP-binding protein